MAESWFITEGNRLNFDEEPDWPVQIQVMNAYQGSTLVDRVNLWIDRDAGDPRCAEQQNIVTLELTQDDARRLVKLILEALAPIPADVMPVEPWPKRGKKRGTKPAAGASN